MNWIKWEDLTIQEQEQARKSYVSIRSDEDGVPEHEVDTSDIDCKSFERMEDGYIFVNV